MHTDNLFLPCRLSEYRREVPGHSQFRVPEFAQDTVHLLTGRGDTGQM